MKKACGLLIGAVFGFVTAFSIIVCSSKSIAAEDRSTRREYIRTNSEYIGTGVIASTMHDNVNNQDYVVVYNEDGIAITPRLPKETD